MAIWRGQSAMPTTGPEIHLKFKLLESDSGLGKAASDAVGLGRIMLRQVLATLNGGPGAMTSNQSAYFDYYFVLGGAAPTTTDFDIVKTTLLITANGLNGQGVGVKVTTDGSALGYVNKHDKRFSLMDKIRSATGSEKKRWTQGVDMYNGQATKRGDIHLDASRLETGPELSAKTLIHEATHKFASTRDFGERGYTWDDSGTFRELGLTRAEAINNAESYARFVMMSFINP